MFVYPDAASLQDGVVRQAGRVTWQDGPIGLRPRDADLQSGNLILLWMATTT